MQEQNEEKRHSTEEIIKLLRATDGAKTIEEVCHEANLSE
jgi:hypothetical protein